MSARTDTVLPGGANGGEWDAVGLYDLDAVVSEAICRVLSIKVALERICPALKGKHTDEEELKNRDAEAIEQKESEEEKIKRIAKQVAAEEIKGVQKEVSEAKRGVDEAKRGVDEAKRGVDETKKELRRTQCGIRNGFYK